MKMGKGRRGWGRPPKLAVELSTAYHRRAKKNALVTAWCSYEMQQEVDVCAKRFGIPRSEMLRTFIEWGIQTIADDLAQGGRGGR